METAACSMIPNEEEKVSTLIGGTLEEVSIVSEVEKEFIYP